MMRNTLGGTGLEVTQLGYGSMGIRGPKTWGVRVVGEEAADQLLNSVFDAGINFIDTSPDYGISEQRIGQYISTRRSEFYLATKCGCVYTQQEDHLNLITRAADTGAGIIIRGGIAHGGPDAEIQRPALNDIWQRAKLDEILPEDMRRAELILRYTLSHPHCHTTIVGTCNFGHLAENLAVASRGPLPLDLNEEIRSRVSLGD